MSLENTNRATDLDYHVARLLILISSFTKPRGGGIDGLTKIAKLDFLIRYPVMLERLTMAINDSLDLQNVRPSESERVAVESRMIRYKYGPWDDNYYPIVGIMLGTGLVEKTRGRGRISVRSTQAGIEISTKLADEQEWSTIAARCRFVAINFDIPGNRLKDLIYQNLPDTVDRPHRTLI